MITRLELMTGVTGYAVRLPRSLTNKLGVKGRQAIEVQVGQAKVTARCSTGSAVATIALSESLLGKLSLRRGMRLHARAEAGILHIGPLIGILVPGTRGGFNPVGNMTLGVAYFIEQGRLAGTYPFAFACSSMDFEKGEVRGYTLSLGGDGYHWIRRTFPLPDVVYDHITYRRRDRAADVRKLRYHLSELNIPFFNAGFFDKWEVHNWLAQNEELHSHLPETQQLSEEALADMCARHKRVFIKPAQGSLGRNISVLTRDGSGYQFRRGRRRYTLVQIKDLESVPAKLPKLSHDFYIVQQGLELCRFRGRRRDFRVIMQRNQAGRWVMTKLFARVAPGGSLVANISAGGTGLQATRSLRRCFSGAKTQSILKEMRRVARRVCTALSETMEGHLGELGIDLGVDTGGHVWVIEVNSKPHRKAYDDMDQKPTAKRAFRRPMQYAAYLAGFRG